MTSLPGRTGRGQGPCCSAGPRLRAASGPPAAGPSASGAPAARPPLAPQASWIVDSWPVGSGRAPAQFVAAYKNEQSTHIEPKLIYGTCPCICAARRRRRSASFKARSKQERQLRRRSDYSDDDGTTNGAMMHWFVYALALTTTRLPKPTLPFRSAAARAEVALEAEPDVTAPIPDAALDEADVPGVTRRVPKDQTAAAIDFFGSVRDAPSARRYARMPHARACPTGRPTLVPRARAPHRRDARRNGHPPPSSPARRSRSSSATRSSRWVTTR